MDPTVVAGNRPPVLAKKYFRSRAKERKIIDTELPLQLLPERSIKGLQKRMDAQVAAQRTLPGGSNSVEQDLVEKSAGK